MAASRGLQWSDGTVSYCGLQLNVINRCGMSRVWCVAMGAICLMSQIDVLNSGIEGQVIIQPVSPIERPEMINSRPYQATVSVLDQTGQVVAEFQSDADGHFRVQLEPGTYVLRPESSRSLPRASKQTVAVSANKFAHVRIIYDSGIR